MKRLGTAPLWGRDRGAPRVGVFFWSVLLALTGSAAFGADLNITPRSAWMNPAGVNPSGTTQWYADVWADGTLAFIGSNRPGGGVYIYDIANPSSPQLISTYAGDEMEDMEVYNGIGYFACDLNDADGTPPRTGVDIVDLSNPYVPTLITRIAPSNPLFPQAHDKVHTLSVSNGFMYTSDNITSTIKVWNVSNPISPQFVSSYNIELPTPPSGRVWGTHEVVAQNGRLYVATKLTSGTNNIGYTHIYDVSQVGTTGPKLMKSIETGGGTHTSMATPDHSLLVIAQERQGGEVRIYDTSMINEWNDPDSVGAPLVTLVKPTSEAWSAHHPMIHGDLLFLSWYEAGLQVYNIADPKNPVLVGSYDTTTLTPSGSFHGNWGVFPMFGMDQVLVSDRIKGLQVLDATALTPKPDSNGNGSVGGDDFLAWQRGFGLSSNATQADGDGNRDKKVTIQDFAVWKRYYGEDGSFHLATAVPEGATVWMLTVGAVLLDGARRRRRANS